MAIRHTYTARKSVARPMDKWNNCAAAVLICDSAASVSSAIRRRFFLVEEEKKIVILSTAGALEEEVVRLVVKLNFTARGEGYLFSRCVLYTGLEDRYDVLLRKLV